MHIMGFDLDIEAGSDEYEPGKVSKNGGQGEYTFS